MTFSSSQGMYFSQSLDCWVVEGYNEAEQVMREAALEIPQVPLPSHLLDENTQTALAPIWAQASNTPLYSSGERHRRLRHELRAPFMPAAVLGHRARIADIAVELLDARVPDGLLEISEDIARPLLTRLMAEIVGIPVPEREAFHRLAHEAMDVGTLGTPDWSSAMLSASCEAHGAIEQMVHRLLADPAEVPVDSVLGESIRRHGAPGALNPAEIATNLRSLYTAGLHTTTPLIAGVAYFLFAEPDVIEAVRADRNTVATLVRETLRYASPAVEVNIRRAVRDTHIGNHCVRAGEFVRTVVLRACRDATRFSDPDRFDLHRGREGKLLAFGTGPHVCLGKHLAIAVAEEICAVLARPRYAARLDAPYPRYVRRGAVPVMWGPEWVHIRIGPAAEGANG